MDGATLLHRLELAAIELSFFYGCLQRRIFVFDPEGLTEDVDWLEVADTGAGDLVPDLPPGRGVIIIVDEQLSSALPGNRLEDTEHPGLIEIF